MWLISTISWLNKQIISVFRLTTQNIHVTLYCQYANNFVIQLLSTCIASFGCYNLQFVKPMELSTYLIYNKLHCTITKKHKHLYSRYFFQLSRYGWNSVKKRYGRESLGLQSSLYPCIAELMKGRILGSMIPEFVEDYSGHIWLRPKQN